MARNVRATSDGSLDVPLETFVTPHDEASDRQVLVDLRRLRRERGDSEQTDGNIDGFATPRDGPGRPILRPYPPRVQWVRDRLFRFYLVFVVSATSLAIGVILATRPRSEWRRECQVACVPLVSIAFTWWHVWLGIKMCFYPVRFRGCCEPWLGWQGIVPRRSNIMAERACDIMVGRLITVEEILDRLDPADFASSLFVVLQSMSRAVLQTIGEKHWPRVWHQVPEGIKEEIVLKSIEESVNLFDPVMRELKSRINEVFNLKEMCVRVLEEDLETLVEMFQQLGRREFVFIEHFSAVMGGVFGLVQLLIFHLVQGLPREVQFWTLPVSGLCIGYLTNWLGINLIFRPVEPHPLFWGYVNFQGVFLKRQHQVAGELATMVCQQLIYSKNIARFIVESPSYETVLEMYRTFAFQAIEQSLGAARSVVPALVGELKFELVKEELVDLFLTELPKHQDSLFPYADRVFDVETTLRDRLRALPPTEFEGMLHPVFQQDEWMVLLLGGVLGVAVGLVQTVSLGI
jgi:uncharacterized membrane protein YheB (UPF0754 family)